MVKRGKFPRPVSYAKYERRRAEATVKLRIQGVFTLVGLDPGTVDPPNIVLLVGVISNHRQVSLTQLNRLFAVTSK